MSEQGGGAAQSEAVRLTITGIISLAGDLGRDDLVERLRIAIARMTRPSTVVCVVGEFKQGKSSLVNAMLDLEVCPVDDDLATSVVTVIRHGSKPTVQVRRREGERSVVESIATDQLRAWVTEDGNRGNEKGIERIDVTAPAPLLESGLVFVDTPGMGGLGAGQAAATLAFLPFADGLVLVTDAGAELSAAEADLLRRAVELCPTLIVALTKIDLHPHWRRLADVDRAHLDRLGCDAPVVAVSSALRSVATEQRDAELDELSGIPRLLAALHEQVQAPAKALATHRAVSEASAVLDQLTGALRAEAALLADPAAAQASLAEFERARDRLEHLRGPGARWSVLVADRMADLSSESSYRFRGALRSTTREVEDKIESLKTPKQWDELSRHLQAMLADAVADVFVGVERGTEAIRDSVVELLAEETLTLPPLPHVGMPTDPRALWSTKSIEPKPGPVSSTLTGLRGAQSGILMFGMMSHFLPAGVAAFLALSPVLLSIGAAFASIQLVDAHKRKVQQRRMAARTNLRQFIDDVQFEVSNELADVLRVSQRSIRDEFGERIAELQRTYADLYRQAQESMSNDEAALRRRHADVVETIARADRLKAALAERRSGS